MTGLRSVTITLVVGRAPEGVCFGGIYTITDRFKCTVRRVRPEVGDGLERDLGRRLDGNWRCGNRLGRGVQLV